MENTQTVKEHNNYEHIQNTQQISNNSHKALDPTRGWGAYGVFNRVYLQLGKRFL